MGWDGGGGGGGRAERHTYAHSSNKLDINSCYLKGPKHDQVGCEFFLHKADLYGYVTWGLAKKIIFIFFGEDILHFVFLANAEHMLKIIKLTISLRLTFFSVCSA